jgi:hypothetical protein
MKARVFIATMLAASTILFNVRMVHAQTPLGLPLAALAGNWAGQGSATFSLCWNEDFTSLVDCDGAPNTAFYSEVYLTQQTTDTKGNTCATTTFTNSVEFPYPPDPAFVGNVIQVSKTTSYNPTTESGTAYVTSYNAGKGTYCYGPTFVNTGGAPPTGTGTTAFSISEHGNRGDGITLTIQNEPVADIDNFVGSGYVNRQ